MLHKELLLLWGEIAGRQLLVYSMCRLRPLAPLERTL